MHDGGDEAGIVDNAMVGWYTKGRKQKASLYTITRETV
jgi:hypothetical protein